jgi:hypothetical protein
MNTVAAVAIVDDDASVSLALDLDNIRERPADRINDGTGIAGDLVLL